MLIARPREQVLVCLFYRISLRIANGVYRLVAHVGSLAESHEARGRGKLGSRLYPGSDQHVRYLPFQRSMLTCFLAPNCYQPMRLSASTTASSTMATLPHRSSAMGN